MSADTLTQLYQQVLLDHSRSPRNHGVLEGIEPVWGDNPLCGDRVGVYLELVETIERITFTGHGCAICKASASLMTEAVQGLTREQADGLGRDFTTMLHADDEPDPRLGDLAIFTGVRPYPTRLKCALLPWHALAAGLDGSSDTVTTE